MTDSRLLLSTRTRLVRAAGLVVFLVGMVVLGGWTCNALLPGGQAGHLFVMKANTAIAFCLAGATLAALRFGPQVNLWGRCGGLAAAVVVSCIGLLTLVEYGFCTDLGIDELLFLDLPGREGTIYPGRMAPATAVLFVLAGGVLALLHCRTDPLLTQGLAGLGLLLAAVYLFGYLESVNRLHTLRQIASRQLTCR